MEIDRLRVLLLDDEASLREPLSQFLRENYSYEVDTAADGAAALGLVERAGGRYHVALIDEVLSGESGMMVLQTLKAKYPDIEVILFTGWGMGAGLDALRAGAYRFLKKPFDAEELALTIRFAAEHGQTRYERKLLDTMQQMMVTINSTLDLKRVLQQTCHFATELFQVDHSGMVMFFDELAHGVLIAEHPAPTGDLGGHLDRGPDLFTDGPAADDHALVFHHIPVQGVPAEERLVRQQEVQNIHDVAAAGDDLGPVRDILLARGIQSILIVPVVLRNRVVASFSLDSVREKRDFYPHQVELCKALARQVAVAFDNARIYEKTQWAIDALARASGVPEVLREIVRSACDLFEADYALIWRYDAQRRTFLPAELVAEGIPPDWLDYFRQDEPEPGRLTHRLIHGEEPYVAVPDLAYAPRTAIGQSTREHLQTLQMQAFQGIRLAAGSEALGVLYVDYKAPRLFGLQDRRLLQDFAHHAALALKRALLLEQITRTRRTARVVARASTVGDLQHTLESVAQGTRETLDCDAVVLYVYDAAQARLRHPPTMVGVRYPDRAMQLDEVPRYSVVYKMLAHDAPHIVEQVEAHPDFAGARFTREEAIKSCVVIPLKAGDTVGLMFANYRISHRFTEEELTDLRLFADMAAVAINNARHVEELEQTKNLMVARTALAWMGMASTTWRHSIDGHALTIRETGKLLQGYCQDLVLDPELRGQIDASVTRIINVAGKILEKPITPPLSSEEAVTTVDINDLLHERLGQLWAGEDYVAVTLRRELAAQPLMVRISPEWFRRAVDIVVANAVKFMRATSTRQLTVSTRQINTPLGDQVEIAFRDTGPGISPAVQKQLFHKRIGKAEDDEGLGMGLLMARAIVQADGGDIRIGATGAEGTTMLLMLPAALPATPAGENR